MSKEILLLGEFSTGKSAFLNMLLEVSILPERLEATDIPVVKIFNGNAAGLWLREKDQKYPRHITRWEDIPNNWNEFDYAELTIPEHPLLKDRIFWDTPGINSINIQHKVHLEKFIETKIEDIDLVIFFLSGNITNTNLEFLKKYKNRFNDLVIVLNIKEKTNSNDIKEIEQYSKSIIYKEIGPVAIEVLDIGEPYDEFIELSEKKRNGLTEWDLLHRWKELKVDIKKIKNSSLLSGYDLLLELCKSKNSLKPSKKELKNTTTSFNNLNEFLLKWEEIMFDRSTGAPIIKVHIFKSVKIGDQIWMTENLNVDHFRNGDIIPEARTDAEWKKAGEMKRPAWCYYNNDPSNGEKYGKLYNWYAVNDPRGLAPKGWHIPSREDFEGLICIANKSAQCLISDTWRAGTGFSAQFGGRRNDLGLFYLLNCSAFFWSHKEYDAMKANYMQLYYNNNNIFLYSSEENYGHSIRCIKDK